VDGPTSWVKLRRKPGGRGSRERVRRVSAVDGPRKWVNPRRKPGEGLRILAFA
jgi:hypothetical protein